MSHSTTTRPGAPERQFVFGPERLRATILTTATETDGRHDLTDGVLPPGATVPLHLHTRYQERLFVVSGSLTVWAGPDTLTLRPGDYYHVPMHVPHTFRAGSEVPARSTSAHRPGSPRRSPAPAPRPTWPPRTPSSTSTCSWRWPPSSVTSCSARREPRRRTSPTAKTPSDPTLSGQTPLRWRPPASSDAPGRHRT
jgi:mannose-6-phosphate isomerase-like protein (cupin superfamily)